ncbi:MAG: ubiquitin-like protein [Candidatus Methanofastidiosia archaeon]
MPTIMIYDKQTGSKHEMEVKPTHTIDSIKSVLSRELGYSKGEINLYLEKTPISDGSRTIHALGLQDGDSLELITGDIGA